MPVKPPGKHVVIISIDGLRPDALAQAEAPVLDSLIAQGSYSPNAKTVSLSITLVSHASMLSGLLPAKHGIEWGVPYIGWPGMNGPTIFSLAHAAGLSTAMVFGKDKLNYLVLTGSVDRLFGQNTHDTEIKEQAIKIIKEGLPNLLFIHFPDTDRVGHDYGWMSTNQLQSVAFVDGLIGEIIAAIDEGGYRDSTVFIITADHGGHNKTHGDDAPQDRTIPWLAVGPGIPAGVTLTTDINTMDTGRHRLRLLDVPVPDMLDGQPIMAVFP
jgi:predicted AlkP superfamily pyrophosphatase or phosphodiesterase